MKEMWLIYRFLSDSYIFSEGKEPFKDRNKHEWKTTSLNELLKGLESVIDKKRNSVLHLREIPEEYVPGIESFLEGTKVQVSYEEIV